MNLNICFFILGITILKVNSKDINNLCPYHVSIEKYGKHSCSGAIISDTIILTTASCIYHNEPLDMNIRVGSNHLGSEGFIKEVKQIIPHNRYLTSRKDYDIALIILESKLTYSDNIQSIPLAKSSLNSPKEGVVGVLSSFGLSEDGLAEELQHENLIICMPSKCKNSYAPLFIYITERMFCAELVNLHPCHGDSGSLFVVNNELLGISAWEHKCGTPRFPGIYTNIANLRNWIKEQVDV